MKNIVFTMILVSFLGCGRKEDSSSDGASVNPLEASKWVTACSDFGRVELGFSGGVNDFKSYSYSDADCTTKKLLVEYKRAYSISGINLDYVYQSSMMTLLTEEAVDDCNASKCWGLEDWKLNVARDIAGLTQDDTKAAKVGGKFYTIFKIDGDVLHFGDTTKDSEDGFTADTRPKDLDTTTAFKKGAL